jgi:D-3-phosphoglycerate dehydrogenase / 2-oxoglutarate reductase
VVLLDRAGDPAAVRGTLADSPGVVVARSDSLPTGAGIVALLVSTEFTVGAQELQALPDVQLVASTATGYDQLDLAAISAAGVWATHCVGYCDEEVAEHALALAIDLLTGITMLDRSVRNGSWDHLAGHSRRVAGAVLGIVGLGRIGTELARRANALGMRVLAADPLMSDAQATGVALVSLKQLLETSDVVSLHAPLNEHTRGLIDAAALTSMRSGAYLVNCARAGLVDHQALGHARTLGTWAGVHSTSCRPSRRAATNPRLAGRERY